jgi:UDP-glucose 4-epimerase
MKKALVTGGNGFIGSHLVDALLVAGYKVRVLDLFGRRFGPVPVDAEWICSDINTEYVIREATTGMDVVFHLAWTSIHETSTREPLQDITSNLEPSVRLVDECYRAGVQRVVFLSSAGTAYGPAQYSPVDEKHPTDPISAYGITKLAVEKYLHLYHHLYDLDYVVLRASVPYGPGQDPRKRQGAISVFLYRLARGKPIEIWGDGSIVRDYFYIDDLVTAALSAAAAQTVPERVFNLGGGRGYSLNELVQVIEKVTGQRTKVEYQAGRPFDVPAMVLDTSRAAAYLKWTPQVELPEGVARTWHWILGLGELDSSPSWP